MPDPERFDAGSYATFRIVGRGYDPATRTVTLRYALDDRVEFVETVTFETPPTGDATAGGPSGVGFERALLHLHAAAGTSYYKTAAPDLVIVEGESLSAGELDLYHRLYDDGLREFAVTNGLEVPRPVTVVPSRGRPATRSLPKARCPRVWWCRSAVARTRWCSSRPSGISGPACSP